MRAHPSNGAKARRHDDSVRMDGYSTLRNVKWVIAERPDDADSAPETERSTGGTRERSVPHRGRGSSLGQVRGPGPLDVIFLFVVLGQIMATSSGMILYFTVVGWMFWAVFVAEFLLRARWIP